MTSILVLVVLFVAVSVSIVRRRVVNARRALFLSHLDLAPSTRDGRPRQVVAFFHPYCNAGGGGERVLWTAIHHMQQQDLQHERVYVVYTGDAVSVSKQTMIDKVQDRFDIALDPTTLHFVPLSLRWLVDDSTWPRFTLAGQSFGSVVLAGQALWSNRGVVPDVWIDTMGYAFAYPLVRYLCRIPVASYTHYPTISTDMVSRVERRLAGHTNPSIVAGSTVLSRIKLTYYRLFLVVYRWSLTRAQVIMVNSSWTKRHVEDILNVRSSAASAASPRSGPKTTTTTRVETKPGRINDKSPSIVLLYPPCDTTSLNSIPLSAPRSSPADENDVDRGTEPRVDGGAGRDPMTILSLAQFRPEKEHPTQLLSLAHLFSLDPKWRSRGVRLVVVGSVRNAQDEQRVRELRGLARELGLENEVEFKVNVEWAELKALLAQAGIGFHTMIDEHFGITLVEFQAAGLIPLAHASAGPLLDILVPYPPPPSERPGSSRSSHDSARSEGSPPRDRGEPVETTRGPTGFLAPPPSSSSSSSPSPTCSPPSSPRDDDSRPSTRPPPSPALTTRSLAEAYAHQLDHILRLSASDQLSLRTRARRSANERFGVETFERGWDEAIERVVSTVRGGGGGRRGGRGGGHSRREGDDGHDEDVARDRKRR
ncbi:hypothetical protein JCM10212_005196 [Sporobolomyces blumeae]